ncbi:MAG: MFS transporter [Xanthomonadaceae bacterium]|jgi:putative MFS transporter|nr:MFS transporter [Xanthomonadaceae bacterium]
MGNARNNAVSKRKLLFMAGLGWLFDAMDVGLLSFVLVAVREEWALEPSQVGWIASINSIGMAVGAFVFGVYADKRGRKAAFMATLLLFSLASGLSAFAWGLGIFMILRFLIGIGLGGELPVASTLVSENVAAHERGRIVVLLESFWAGGWIVAAMIGFFLIQPFPGNGWRVAMLLCALPALYVFYLRRNLPDSNSFNRLRPKDREESILRKWMALWSCDHRRSTAMLWIVWFCVVFSYYGMFLWLPSVVTAKFGMKQGFGYVLLMTLAQLPGYFTVAWLIERIGRKAVLTVYLSGTMISACWFGVADTPAQVLAAGAMLSFFNLGAWGALYAYTPEQYTAKIRATGAGFAAAVGRIGGVFGPLMVGYLLAAGLHVAVVFGIFGAALLLAVLAIVILGKETKQLVID